MSQLLRVALLGYVFADESVEALRNLCEERERAVRSIAVGLGWDPSCPCFVAGFRVDRGWIEAVLRGYGVPSTVGAWKLVLGEFDVASPDADRTTLDAMLFVRAMAYTDYLAEQVGVVAPKFGGVPGHPGIAPGLVYDQLERDGIMFSDTDSPEHKFLAALRVRFSELQHQVLKPVEN